MGLFDDPVGYLNGGLYGPAGQDLTSYLGNVLSGQYALKGIQGANDAFRNNDYEALAGMFGPGAMKTPKLDRIDALTADRLSGERGGVSAGSPVSSFSAIQAAEPNYSYRAPDASVSDLIRKLAGWTVGGGAAAGGLYGNTQY